MPIEQVESGLGSADYTELAALDTGGAYTLTLQRVNFLFSLSGGSASGVVFDACVSTSYIIRIRQNGSDLTVERSTDGNSWSTRDTISSIAAQAVACWADGDDIRVWYVESDGAIYYEDSADDGDTWGSPTLLTTLANTKYLAPTALAKLHIATYDNYNTRLHYYTSSLTSSPIYYPAQFDGFDAETVDDTDVIVFCADGQIRYDTKRQGVWVIRQRNGRWSDPSEMDVLDEYVGDEYERSGAQVTLINGRLFATFVSIDSGFSATAYSTSADGRYWQHRQPMGAITSRGCLHILDDTVYLIGAGDCYESDSTVISLNSTVDTDVTSRLAAYSGSRQRMYQSTITLHNEDGGVDSLMGDNRYQIVEELGYWGAADKVVQQIALTEVDTFGHNEGLPEDTIVLSSRDRLAWMADRTEADHYEEWESQLRHWDDFENSFNEADQKDILYSGLRHTASLRGRWDTSANTLRSIGSNVDSLALCSIDKFIGHTIVQEAFKISEADNDEYAGVVVRAIDEDNLWSAYYDTTDDKVKLRKMSTGAWLDAVASTSALSWAVETWYWLRVEARLSLFTVYYSTDGLTWTEAFEYVDNSFSSYGEAFQEGYVGHAAYGYSDQDTEPEEPDPYRPPGMPDTDLDLWQYDQIIIGTAEPESYHTAVPDLWGAGQGDGVKYCDDIDSVSPTWVDFSTGLVATGANIIHDLRIMRWADGHDTLFASCYCGIYEYTDLPAPGGTWNARITAAAIAAVVSIATFDWVICDRIIMSLEHEGWGWAAWHASWCPHLTCYQWYGVVHTRDGWQTIYSASIGDSRVGWHARSHISDLGVAQHSDGDVVYVAGCLTQLGGPVTASLYKSTDGGSTLSLVDTITGLPDRRRCCVHVPYHSDDWNDSVVYWGCGTVMRRSTNSGSTFSTVDTAPDILHSISGPTFDKDILTVRCLDDEVYEWTLGTSFVGFGPGYSPSFAGLTLGRKTTNYLDEYLMASNASTTGVVVNDADTQYNKTGNFYSVSTQEPWCVATLDYNGWGLE